MASNASERLTPGACAEEVAISKFGWLKKLKQSKLRSQRRWVVLEGNKMMYTMMKLSVCATTEYANHAS